MKQQEPITESSSVPKGCLFVFLFIGGGRHYAQLELREVIKCYYYKKIVFFFTCKYDLI